MNSTQIVELITLIAATIGNLGGAYLHNSSAAKVADVAEKVQQIVTNSGSTQSGTSASSK